MSSVNKNVLRITAGSQSKTSLNTAYLLHIFKYAHKFFIDGQTAPLDVPSQVSPCAETVFSEEN